MNIKMFKILSLFIIVVLLFTCCNYKNLTNPIEKIAYVVFDYSYSFTNGEKYYDTSISLLNNISKTQEIDILTCNYKNEEIDITSIKNWLELNKNAKKVVIFEQQLFDLSDDLKEQIDDIDVYMNTFWGIMSYFPFNNECLTKIIDFIVCCNDDESYGRDVARRCAKQFDGLEGCIILDRNATSGQYGAIYYQKYFLDEFKLMESRYDLSKIRLVYDDELILSTDDEKVDIIKKGERILAVVEGYSYTDWNYVLEKANVSNVVRFNISRNTDEEDHIEYYLNSYDTAIETAINIAYDILKGKEIEAVTLVDCSYIGDN